MIKIYDNVFSLNYAAKVWAYVLDSSYLLGWTDSQALEHTHNVCLHSKYTIKDITNLGILEELKNHDVGGLVHLNNMKQNNGCIVNLSCPGQTHVEHTHHDTDVILYYVNPVWNRSWSGETLFYSDDGVELERAVEYIPNRLVFFNGEHPHTIRPASFEATFYRFTISLFFDREYDSFLKNSHL